METVVWFNLDTADRSSVNTPVGLGKGSVQRPNSWRNSEKSLKSFPLVIHSHFYYFALRFLFLQTHTTSYSFCKGERFICTQLETRLQEERGVSESRMTTAKSVRLF
jgi:hypothetical protein